MVRYSWYLIVILVGGLQAMEKSAPTKGRSQSLNGSPARFLERQHSLQHREEKSEKNFNQKLRLIFLKKQLEVNPDDQMIQDKIEEIEKEMEAFKNEEKVKKRASIADIKVPTNIPKNSEKE